MKYRFTGSDARHLPKLGITVLPGEMIESKYIINHPDFEQIEERVKKSKKK